MSEVDNDVGTASMVAEEYERRGGGVAEREWQAAAAAAVRSLIKRALQAEARVRELESEYEALGADWRRCDEARARNARERDAAQQVALVLATYAPHTDEHQAARATAVGYAGLKLPVTTPAEPEVAP